MRPNQNVISLCGGMRLNQAESHEDLEAQRGRNINAMDLQSLFA